MTDSLPRQPPSTPRSLKIFVGDRSEPVGCKDRNRVSALQVAHPVKNRGSSASDLCNELSAVAPFLRSQVVAAIVTLFDRPLQPNPEDLGFRSLFVETPNYRPPPDLLRVIVFMEDVLDQGAVLVHCYAGIGRTGTVLCAWLLRQDPTLLAADAIARVRENYIPAYARTRFPEDPSQAEAIERFAQSR
jgi:Polymorphic toxin system, DSP-PTPase phosphatase